MDLLSPWSTIHEQHPIMKQRTSALGLLELVVVAVTVIIGWVVFAGQLARVGWISGGGTAWLLAFAAVATLGAGGAVVARRAGRHALTALGLGVAATAPTGFAYIFNVVVLVLALIEGGIAIVHRGQGEVSSPHESGS